MFLVSIGTNVSNVIKQETDINNDNGDNNNNNSNVNNSNTNTNIITAIIIITENASK